MHSMQHRLKTDLASSEIGKAFPVVRRCEVRWARRVAEGFHGDIRSYIQPAAACNSWREPAHIPPNHSCCNVWLRSEGFCHQKCHFSFVRKCKFRPKFSHKSRISPVFRHPKMRPFQQCITATAVNLFYEVLPKQFEAFGFNFSQKKKQLTAEYWVSWTVAFFAWNHTVSWQVINHYILQCHIVKLDLMFSLHLRQIMPPKMLFFVHQKVQISSKILPQIAKVANFVKFREKSTFSSQRPVFVISSVFRQK